MRKRTLLQALLALTVVAVLVMGAAPATHAAPASPRHAATCTGDTIVRDAGQDVNTNGDLVWVEAQIRQDSCGDLRDVGIFEVDAGCLFGAYCNSSLTGEVDLIRQDGAVVEGVSNINIPLDGNYHGYGNVGITNWPERGWCYYATADFGAPNNVGGAVQTTQICI